MFLVEKTDNEIKVTNEFSFIGDSIVENISSRGVATNKYRKINMLKLKEFSFVEPYFVVLGLMGLSREEIQKNIILSQLSLIDKNGFVSGSNVSIKTNQLPAFLDPNVYQTLSFVELVFFDDDGSGEKKFFFFDINSDDLLNIDRYCKRENSSDNKLKETNNSSEFTFIKSVGSRLKSNAAFFNSANTIAFAAIPSMMFCFGLISFVPFVFFISFFVFNVFSFLSLISFSSSKISLINPFLSFFCLSKEEYFLVIKKGAFYE